MQREDVKKAQGKRRHIYQPQQETSEEASFAGTLTTDFQTPEPGEGDCILFKPQHGLLSEQARRMQRSCHIQPFIYETFTKHLPCAKSVPSTNEEDGQDHCL